MKRFLAFCASVISSVSLIHAQSVDTKRLDSLLSMVATHNKASGCAVFQKSGKIIYQRGFGNAVNGPAAEKAGSQTIFRIGSVSKTFTAVMIMQLIEEKKLSLDTKLAAFFPTIPTADSITIDQLLSHRSGLYNFTKDSSFYNHDTEVWDELRLLKLIESHPKDFAPGEKTEYSNTNFSLLGMIIEKADKRKYAESLQARIAKPLKLNSVRVFDSKPGKDAALSYEWSDGRWNATPLSHPSGPGGAGAIASNAADLATFMTALNQGHILQPGSLAHMQLVTDGLGRGLMQIPWGSRRAWGHGGKIDAYNTLAGYFPDDSVAMVVLTNGAAMNTNDLAIGLLSIFYQAPGYQLPDYSHNVVVPDSLMDAYAGIYRYPEANMDITITKTGDGLSAQATGQGAFPIDALSNSEFVFETAGIRIKFDKPAGGFSSQLTLYQGGSIIPFKRKQ